MSDELSNFAQRYAKAWCSQNPESVAAFFAKNGSISINRAARDRTRGDCQGSASIHDNISGHGRDIRQTGTARRPNSFSLDFDRNEQRTGGTGNKVLISGYEL